MFREKPYTPKMVELEVEPEQSRYRFSRFPSKPEPSNPVFPPMPPADPNIPIHCGLQDEKALPKVATSAFDSCLTIRVDENGYVVTPQGGHGYMTSMVALNKFMSISCEIGLTRFLADEITVSRPTTNTVNTQSGSSIASIGESAFPYPILPPANPIPEITLGHATNGAYGSALAFHRNYPIEFKEEYSPEFIVKNPQN